MSMEIIETTESIDNIEHSLDFACDLDPTNILNTPKKYKVVLYNDDFTPMEFVIRLLQDVFRVTEEVATNIMLKVHYNGQGVCGYFVKDIAQTKANAMVEKARKHSYPLLCQAQII